MTDVSLNTMTSSTGQLDARRSKPKYATVGELVTIAHTVVQHHLARITEWNGRDDSGIVPIFDLTGCNEEASKGLFLIAAQLHEAIGRIGASAKGVENWSDPPSAALVETVTTALAAPLTLFRQLLSDILQCHFEQEIGDDPSEFPYFYLSTDRLFQTAAADIVQMTLAMNFLREIQDASAEAPGDLRRGREVPASGIA